MKLAQEGQSEVGFVMVEDREKKAAFAALNEVTRTPLRVHMGGFNHKRCSQVSGATALVSTIPWIRRLRKYPKLQNATVATVVPNMSRHKRIQSCLDARSNRICSISTSSSEASEHTRIIGCPRESQGHTKKKLASGRATQRTTRATRGKAKS